MTALTTAGAGPRQGLLRRALQADALACAAFGLTLATLAGPLATSLGLPVLLPRIVGLGLLPYAALVALLAGRATISRRLAWGVVALNLLWAADSLLLLLSGWVAPTTLGVVFIVLQALLVAGIAGVQLLGLRRSA